MHPKISRSVRPSSAKPVEVNTIARRVPLMLRQIHRPMAVITQAQPMIVIAETQSNRYQPIKAIRLPSKLIGNGRPREEKFAAIHRKTIHDRSA